VARGRRTKTKPKSKSRHRLIVDPETSKRLGRIRQHGTSAELIVRRSIFALGHRYRTQNRDLPGSPDLANRSKKWAVFVHGCFWHRHKGCTRTTTPKRNRAFWLDKFTANISRDRRAISALRRCGWIVVVIWECEADQGLAQMARRIHAGLGR